jgi:hypothetical protein
MTKGNWERRAEMSLIRRTEAKEKKASKSDTTKINTESILQKECYANATCEETIAGIRNASSYMMVLR